MIWEKGERIAGSFTVFRHQLTRSTEAFQFDAQVFCNQIVHGEDIERQGTPENKQTIVDDHSRWRISRYSFCNPPVWLQIVLEIFNDALFFISTAQPFSLRYEDDFAQK